ncbi:MAG: adenylate/guanylate cyclase domain-containing protein [Lysobacteraceae bacterium]
MGHSWKQDRSDTRIATRYKEVEGDKVKVVEYKREMSLDNIPVWKAYRMDAAHLYIDIINISELLGYTDSEGETCHKRTLRFLNQHYRAVHRILSETDAIRVDFHNQRLHAIVPQPYGKESEFDRVARAVAIAKLAIDVLAETGDDDEQIPNAKVRVGIDSGCALVVNNGRRNSREPLFLGSPANLAAHCAGGGTAEGIYLTNNARSVMGFPIVAEGKDKITALTQAQIDTCIEKADIGVSKDKIVQAWREEQKDHPIGSFDFTRPTPPLSNLDFELLNASNSKRFEGISLYADIDGFTAFVDKHLDDNAEDLVRGLHLLRSELDAVVQADFGGRRVRFIGDCLHGVLLEGTSKTTDVGDTISTATLCAGGLRSGFERAMTYLKGQGVDVDDLGLAIGLELGPISLTRLGMKGDKIRCSTGRAVYSSEEEQKRCNGTQSAIGADAYKSASTAVKELFGASRLANGLSYNAAVDQLNAAGDRVAKAVYTEAMQVHAPAIVPSLSEPLRPHSKG